jgi:hypothetical protein
LKPSASKALRSSRLGWSVLQFSFDGLKQLQNLPIFEAHIGGLAGIHGGESAT